MALIIRKRKDTSKKEEVEIKKDEKIKTQEVLADDSTASGKETENKEVKATGEKISEVKSKPIKKGSKIIANGRCFGSASLECPLKAGRNYETKVLDVDKTHGSVLIDEGWINKDFVK